MKIIQTTYNIELDDGKRAILRVLEKQQGNGCWPGTKYKTREWTVVGDHPTCSCAYGLVSIEKAMELEKQFGETRASDLFPYEHKTLGLVLGQK